MPAEDIRRQGGTRLLSLLKPNNHLILLWFALGFSAFASFKKFSLGPRPYVPFHPLIPAVSRCDSDRDLLTLAHTISTLILVPDLEHSGGSLTLTFTYLFLLLLLFLHR